MQSKALLLLALVAVSSTASLRSDRLTAIMTQVKDLKSLKCEPKGEIISLRELLEPTSPLNHCDFYPTLAVVQRCDPRCGFCGDAYGRQTGLCRPVKTSEREIVVTYEDHRTGEFAYKIFPMENHDECSCQT